MQNKAIKYRIYPTKEQQIMFAKTFGCCRKVYNLMLSDKIANYAKTKSFGKQTPAMYKDDYPFLKEVDSLALANVQLNLQQAFKNCFHSKHCEFPVFKSAKRDRKSYTTNNQNGTISIIDKKIKLPKIGYVKAKIHRLPKDTWNLKSATVSMKASGKYYVSILFEYEENITPITSFKDDNVIGLDYKSDGLYMDSDNNIGSNHKYYRESHNKLLKAQRNLSRMIESHIIGYKTTGNKRFPIYDKPISECQNIRKQRIKVAKIHEKIANQRFDSLHKLSTEIANSYDAVCVEDLDMKALSNHGFGNGKATLDNGYGLFLSLLEYKLSDRGKRLIKIDKFYPSSQVCSCCGNRMKLALSDRTYNCPVCKLSIDRDYNAAINIKREGLRLLKA